MLEHDNDHFNGKQTPEESCEAVPMTSEERLFATTSLLVEGENKG